MSTIKKLKKISLIAVLAFALVLGAGAGSAQAALTFTGTNVTGTGAITVDGVAGTVYTVGTATNTGGIVLGNSTDDNTIAVGNADPASGKTTTINIGAGAGNTDSGKSVVVIGSNSDTGVSTVDIKVGKTGGFTVTGVADSTITLGTGITTGNIAIGGALTTGTLTLGKSTQTAATTIYGGSTTNAIRLLPNVGAVATEAHGLDVVSVGELSSGDNLVGVNSVLTPTGTAGTWASAVYGKVVQGATKTVNGYISGGEFEVADTNAAPSEVHTLVLDGNSTVFDANSSYIWGQTFGGADMPNLLKLTGLASGTGNMWYGPTLRMKIGDSSVASRYLIMSETENKLDLGDGSGGIDIGTATTGINFTGTNSSAITLSSMTPGAAAGPLILAGTSASPISTATADTKFVQMYTKSTATGAGSDTRGIYDRLYLAGATTGGGEALRAYTTIDDAVVGTAHGAHISLDFDSTANSAQLTGLGVAGRNTLHIPSDAAWTSGTLAAVQAEIFSDGANSDSDGLTELSFIRVINDGNATGKGNVDDDAVVFSLQGFTDGAGNVFKATAPTTLGASLRVKVGSTIYYLPLYTTQ